MRGGKRAIDCGDFGMSSNCPDWSDRHFLLLVLMAYRMIYEFKVIGAKNLSNRPLNSLLPMFSGMGETSFYQFILEHLRNSSHKLFAFSLQLPWLTSKWLSMPFYSTLGRAGRYCSCCRMIAGYLYE
jgi:hypothetical protein